MFLRFVFGLLISLALSSISRGETPRLPSSGQPLAGNITRVTDALVMLGHPLPRNVTERLQTAQKTRDAVEMQKRFDPFVHFVVSINPEGRVKVAQGDALPVLQQAGFIPLIVKVLNEGSVTSPLGISSPQAGASFAGSSEFSLQRQQQTTINDRENPTGRTDRFLDVEMLTERPMRKSLTGELVEYAIALFYSSESGTREATIEFDTGQGTQDLGFRAEIPISFSIRPAVKVRLGIYDDDGSPTIARLEFTDSQGHVYPPQARRIAPDFFFQKQIYRGHKDSVLLPPGRFEVKASRGPEYRVLSRRFMVPSSEESSLEIRLQRWINTEQFGFYSGDHHIHAAGCAHYQLPTQGVSPFDMFLQVKGEGLNVGCVLTWGPCFEFQRQFFSPQVDSISDRKTKLKYDLEISGFGSAPLGHVCLLNLRDQTFPESEGTKSQGWPTWTLPILQWAKSQGSITGYAHSASGMHVVPQQATDWIFKRHDKDGNQFLSPEEAKNAVLPQSFESIDMNRDSKLSPHEVMSATDDAAERLPNFAMPGMNGVGAMELPVTVAHGVCDFISAMDTARIQEWNTWYHVLNCGFPLKVSGETDFPCMSSTRVGQGRVYVQMGSIDELDFLQWCENLKRGASYVSDGYDHAIDFRVNGRTPGDEDVNVDSTGKVIVNAKVAFAPATPRTVAQGLVIPETGQRLVGDTVQWNQQPTEEYQSGGTRVVELVVNGRVVERRSVPADGQIHKLEFSPKIVQSSWIAIRQFPQMHTNPVNVRIQGKPIAASRKSADWCAEIIRLLWNNRERNIAPEEREAAKAAYDRAIAIYEAIELASQHD